LINEDLPTLLLPIKANSGLSGGGVFEMSGLLIRYSAEEMIMRGRYKLKVKSEKLKVNTGEKMEIIGELKPR
jgi:hypothetical protein